MHCVLAPNTSHEISVLAIPSRRLRPGCQLRHRLFLVPVFPELVIEVRDPQLRKDKWISKSNTIFPGSDTGRFRHGGPMDDLRSGNPAPGVRAFWMISGVIAQRQICSFILILTVKFVIIPFVIS